MPGTFPCLPLDTVTLGSLDVKTKESYSSRCSHYTCPLNPHLWLDCNHSLLGKATPSLPVTVPVSLRVCLSVRWVLPQPLRGKASRPVRIKPFLRGLRAVCVLTHESPAWPLGVQPQRAPHKPRTRRCQRGDELDSVALFFGRFKRCSAARRTLNRQYLVLQR